MQLEEMDVYALKDTFAAAEDPFSYINKIALETHDKGYTCAFIAPLDGVPMGYVEGTVFVATLACTRLCKQHDPTIQIEWPSTLINSSGYFGSIRIQAGYRSFDCSVLPGIFAVIICEFAGEMNEDVILEIVAAMKSDIVQWVVDIKAKKIQVGPVSGCLSEYFDYVAYMDEEVFVAEHTGRLSATGVLKGLDVWGQALVVDSESNELAVNPARARLIPASSSMS